MNITQVRSLANVKVTQNELDKISRDLVLRSTQDDTSICLVSENEDGTLGVPIGYLNPPCKVEDRNWTRCSLPFNGAIQPKQSIYVDEWFNTVKTGNGGIIKAPTGTGKTVMALWIMSMLGYKTLVIVPTEYLIGQWKERISQFIGVPEHEIGICRQNVCDYKGKSIVIGMIHSLAKTGKYPTEFYNEFGLVIVDEVHKLSAPTFSQSLPQFWSKYRLGLSATPRRKDGLENVFIFHIGKVCNTKVLEAIKPNVVILKYNNSSTDHLGCVYGGNLSLGRYFNRVAKVEHRNLTIARVVKALRTKGYDVLVLSDRIAQLATLNSMLQKDGINDIGIFTGSKKSGLDRPTILATYGSAGLGADIPRLSAVVFATPRVDVEQPMGRVLRETKDKPQIVVDIIDTASSIMEKWGYARMKFYKKSAGKITFKEVNA